MLFFVFVFVLVFVGVLALLVAVLFVVLITCVMVVVTGEFGRTPKIKYDRSTGAGDASAPAGTATEGDDMSKRSADEFASSNGLKLSAAVP